jgi:signal transduction histidine kinase
MKFTPEGGNVSIRVYSIDKLNIEIEVRDTGIGIESNIINDIFNRFGHYKAYNNKNFHSCGAGLGLTISNKIAIFVGKK